MTKLMLTFVSGNGNRVTMTVPQPRENLTEDQVRDAMEEIVESEVFQPGGKPLLSPHQAKIVEDNTTVIYKA